MPLPVGERAPDFQIKPGLKLSDLGKPAVIYFYPKDDTPGCTIEAKEFQQQYFEISRTGAEVLGISTDDETSHAAFCDKYGLTFPLVPDANKSISTDYEVLLAEKGYAGRVTFLVDGEGYIRKVWDPVNPTGHALELVDAIRAMGRGEF
ncbi:MAG: peroxiredoxin [bacterium]